MIVVVGTGKGGTGKTTLAINLAAMRMRDKGDVILVDAEPIQKSSTIWCSLRDEGEVKPRVTSANKVGQNIANDLKEFDKKFSTVIVDVGGQDSTELRASLLVANVVVSPFKASAFDIFAIGFMDTLVGKARIWNESMRGYILINSAPTNLFILNSKKPEVNPIEFAKMEFENKGFENVKLMDFTIGHRTVFEKITGGKSVHEIGTDSTAEDELEKLYQEIFNV